MIMAGLVLAFFVYGAIMARLVGDGDPGESGLY